MNGFGYLQILKFLGGLHLLIDVAFGALIIRPNNTEARKGERVVLQCSTDQLKQALSWVHTPYSDTTEEWIFRGSQRFVDGDRLEPRRGVLMRSNERYDLVIDDVQKSDAGNYTCEDVTGEKATVTLIVLDAIKPVPAIQTDCFAVVVVLVWMVVIIAILILIIVFLVLRKKLPNGCRKCTRDQEGVQEGLLPIQQRTTETESFLLKTDLLNRLRRAREVFVDRLDISHGLLDMLVGKSIISEEQKRHVKELDEELRIRQFFDFPAHDWDRLRSEQQTIKCNKKLMDILEETNCDTIDEFLACLIQTNQAHLANAIKYEDANSKVRTGAELMLPLDYKEKNILIVRFNRLEAEISASMETKDKFENSIFEKLRTNNCISQERFDKIKRINENNGPARRKELSRELLSLLKISSKQALQLTEKHFSRSDLIKKLLGEKVEQKQNRAMKTFQIDNGSWVEGVAVLGSKIYACCWRSCQIFVFSNESGCRLKCNQTIQNTTLKISSQNKTMKFPWDMIGYEIEDSTNQTVQRLLISDNQWDDGCLWIVEHLNDDDRREVGRIEVDGIPDKMSLISYNGCRCVALLIRKQNTSGIYEWRLDIIKMISDARAELVVHNSIPLSRYEIIKHPWHVIQRKNSNLILLHETNSSTHEQHDFLITELSVTENTIDIIQSIDPFYPTPQSPIRKRNLWPQHMAIDENDRIYISDYGNELVVTVDYQTETKKAKVFLDYSLNSLVGPIRLQYLEGQNQLIVAQVGQFSVFQTEAYPTTVDTYDSVKVGTQ